MIINFFKNIFVDIFDKKNKTIKPLNVLDKKITFEKLEKNTEEFLNFFYTFPEAALEEIKSRRKNKQETAQPIKGIIHRDITPNIEINRMISVCDTLDIEPIFFDNPCDKFSCLSRTKYRLAKMVFLLGYNKSGSVNTETKKIINFDNAEGKPLQSIQTTFHKNLIEFHKDIFKRKYPAYQNNILDIATLIKKNNTKEVYTYLFNLSIEDAIFIENFSLHSKEKEFLRTVVFPTFFSVWKKTGLKPLLVPSEPLDIEQEEFWLYYATDIKDFLPNN